MNTDDTYPGLRWREKIYQNYSWLATSSPYPLIIITSKMSYWKENLYSERGRHFDNVNRYNLTSVILTINKGIHTIILTPTDTNYISETDHRYASFVVACFSFILLKCSFSYPVQYKKTRARIIGSSHIQNIRNINANNHKKGFWDTRTFLLLVLEIVEEAT